MRPAAAIGQALEEVDTPALILDLDAFEKNLSALDESLRGKSVRVRPHAKTHKCPEIAKRQLAAGAVGVCCQKVSEAEALVEGGITDILVSNEVVGAPKIARLVELSRHARIGVCVDNIENLRQLENSPAKLDVYVELEVGMGRCGVAAGQAAAALAKQIDAAPGLKFLGLQAYQGRAQHLEYYAERAKAIESAAAAVRLSKEAIEREGMRCEVIAGGGTGTFMFEGRSNLWTELQCGSYIFMDGEYSALKGSRGEPYEEFEQSLFVLSTVMSVAGEGRAILDAGLKSYSLEKGLPTIHGPHVGRLIKASDEHGTVELAPGAFLQLGTKLKLAPSHCDPTINLHDQYVCIRNDRVEAIWPILARGASS